MPSGEYLLSSFRQPKSSHLFLRSLVTFGRLHDIRPSCYVDLSPHSCSGVVIPGPRELSPGGTGRLTRLDVYPLHLEET